MKNQCKNCLSFCMFFLFVWFVFEKVPNAKYCIETNGFSMFLGFAQFGKQSKNSKQNSKKQARKSNEQNMTKSLKQHYFFINFHDFFSHEKCIDFFMHFSWKMGSKMEPKSMPKSYNNDFGRPKGRPGECLRLGKRRKKGAPKIDAKKGFQKKTANIPESIVPGSPRARFWSRRGGKEGTSPSGTGGFRL